MPRGGLRVDQQGTTNHLFKPKWNNKKTTAIRIPEIFKDSLLGIARYLDNLEFLEQNGNNIPQKLADYNRLKSEAEYYQNKLSKFKEENKKLLHNQKQIDNQNSQKTKQNKYQIAVECFGEFVESQNFNMEELSKSRKGTKKHQLYEINQWLIEQSKSSK